jgi:NAD(P)-dependent dehydrogenase (short-subunit alcohol dehydrogenase family)
MDRLKGKTAIVTGGANGIGRAIAEMFAGEGAWVLIADIEGGPGKDVSRPADAARAVAQAATHNGRIDILVNNAAFMGETHAVLESTPEEWSKCLGIAVMGMHYFTKETLPYMIKQKAGSIVNIVSIQALAGMMTSVPYTTSKAAQLGYTLSVAYDYGPDNIRINALCPGPIQTRISPAPGDPHYKWQCDNTCLGRVGYPREVAYAALFLASDEASYVTGVTLPVDGGWTSK